VPVVLTSKGAPGDAIKRIHGWGAVALHDIANRRHAGRWRRASTVSSPLPAAPAAIPARSNPFALDERGTSAREDSAVVRGRWPDHAATC
jgi:nitronate monooxygenase